MLSVEELNDRLIELAFSEDIGDGDHTTLCYIPAEATGESRLLIKEEGILAGVNIAKKVFHNFDPELKVPLIFTPCWATRAIFPSGRTGRMPGKMP